MSDDKKYVPDPGAPSMEQMRKAAALGDFLRANDDLISPWKYTLVGFMARKVGRLNRDWGETTARLQRG